MAFPLTGAGGAGEGRCCASQLTMLCVTITGYRCYEKRASTQVLPAEAVPHAASIICLQPTDLRIRSCSTS